MRASSLRKRPIRRESGNYWLSFSDMMSVLVLVFIFVIFSMMLSLNRQKEQLEKTEDQYAEAMARIEASEQALSEKETLLADSEAQLQVLTQELADKTLILVERERELSVQAEQIALERSEMESALIVLNGEKDALNAQLAQTTEEMNRLANTEAELEESKLTVIDLTRQLTELRDSYAKLQGDYESQRQQIVLLGQQNSALMTDAEKARQAISEAEAENARLSQRISMLNGNAESKQSENDRLLKLIEDKQNELDALGIEYAELLSFSSRTQSALETAETTLKNQTAQLTELRDSYAKLQGDYESQKQQIILLGQQNSALMTDAEKAREAVSEAEAENARLSQRISMLNGNAESKQSEIERLLKLIEDKQKELDALGIEYAQLLSFSTETQSALETAETTLKNQTAQLAEQSGQITQYEESLAGYRDELARTQGQLEQMVGVKAQIVQSLSNALRANDVDVTVDYQTGAIRLPSEMLFAQDSNALSNEGKRYLDRFLPVYMSVLLSDEFRPYIAEIIIEGHTDSRGSYIYNLGLSQDRALSVASYVLDDRYIKGTLGLSNGNGDTLRALITASGRSFSAPIRNASGQEDQDASRRVEIKFRLKDDETVALTESLLELIGNE